MPPQESEQGVTPVPNQSPAQVLSPQPKTKIVSLLMACFVGLITIGLVYIAVIDAISFWAMFYCTGWNEGSGQVTSCSIPGIENWANNGYNMILIAAFSFGSILIIPAGVAYTCGSYWYKKSREWENENIPTRLFVWTGISFSVFSLLVFIAPIAWAPVALIIDGSNSITQSQKLHQKLATPTVNHFVCEEQSIDIDSVGAVSENSYFGSNGSNQILITTLIGAVDTTSDTFTWQALHFVHSDYTTGLVSRYKKELQTCINVNGKTVLGLYKEVPSTNFYQ